MQYEPSVTGKWLAMLKEIAPRLTRVAFMINPKTAPFYNYYLAAAEPLSQSLGIELVPTFVENPTEINRAIESFARVEWRSARAAGCYDLRPSRSHHCACGAAQVTGGLLISSSRPGGWSHVLRNRPCRHVSAGGILGRASAARRQVGRAL